MGGRALVLWLFAVTLFVSAFLLFLVQPMIGKMILPNLGGTPQVWNTCMVFFQAALLAGYGYTHFVSTQLKLRMQLILHGIVLFVPLLVFALGSFRDKTMDWFPPPGSNPILFTLLLLLVVVGVPFFVVATSAPLLQRWFSYTGHPAAKDPYFLYGASNIGSFGSLLAYPFLVEWSMNLQEQSWLWVGGYALLLVLVLLCAGLVWKTPETVDIPKKVDDAPKPTPEPEPEAKETKKETGFKAGTGKSKGGGFKKGKAGAKGKGKFKAGSAKKAEPKVSVTTPSKAAPSVQFSDDVTWLRRLRWIGLAAVPSSMMLGVTTYITTDLTPSPILWLLPLMIYLLTFVLVFSRWEGGAWTGLPHTIFLWIQPFFLFLLIPLVALGQQMPGGLIPTVVVHLLAFTVTTFVCHGELAKDRPSTMFLTEFYLWMSVGGVVGGIFNALLAPVMFWDVYEYAIIIFVAAILRPRLTEADWLDDLVGSIMESGPRDKASVSPATTLLDIGLPILVLLVAGGLAMARSSLVDALSRPGYTMLFCAITFFLCIFLMGRPIRFGASVGIILAVLVYSDYVSDKNTIYRDRSYFGILQVRYAEQPLRIRENGRPVTKDCPYTSLMHGTTHHGMCFLRPKTPSEWGDYHTDLSRLPTTYYHLKCPVGQVMQKFNWFSKDLTPGDALWKYQDNLAIADARMPVSILGALGNVGVPTIGAVPDTMLVNMWSEPPYATIGLGTGTMATYGHPYQHVHYYEIDDKVLDLSIRHTDIGELQRTPPKHIFESEKYKRPPYFTFLRDAHLRGAEVWVFMGDARQRMKRGYGWNPTSSELELYPDNPFDRFRQNPFEITVINTQDVIEGKDGEKAEEVNGGPESFYHMMVVDAFSSDAIPAHLITQESMEMYFRKLTDDGVLCVHTSNRHVNLVVVVADVAEKMKEVENFLFEVPSVDTEALNAGKVPKDLKDKIIEKYDADSFPGTPEVESKKDKEDNQDTWRISFKTKPYQFVIKKKGEGMGVYKAPFPYITCRRGHDSGPKDIPDDPETKNINEGEMTIGDLGHFTSEWVMVARKGEYMDFLGDGPPGYVERASKSRMDTKYWGTPTAYRRYVWTDDYYNVMGVMRHMPWSNKEVNH